MVFSMTDGTKDPIFGQVMAEQNQIPATRTRVIKNLERILGRPVIVYFTSFNHPVMITDEDADMLEGLLQKMDLSNGLALVINSPGGSGLTAERIIRACRSYSGTDEYWAIVPNKAKSAATMVCFGASKILMGPTSELGPIDPQIKINTNTLGSAYNVIKSYEDLFDRATKSKGRLEPYLQQLSNYNEKEIDHLRMIQSLSEDIAVKTLANGMMKGISEDDIRSKIQIFLTPEETKTHGRPIYRSDALKCGLKVEKLDAKDDLWKVIYELYIRMNNYVSGRVSKSIETKTYAYAMPIPKGGGKND